MVVGASVCQSPRHWSPHFTTMTNFICLWPDIGLSTSLCYISLALRRKIIFLLIVTSASSTLTDRHGPSSLTGSPWTHPSAPETTMGRISMEHGGECAYLEVGIGVRVLAESSHVDNLTCVYPSCYIFDSASVRFYGPCKVNAMGSLLLLFSLYHIYAFVLYSSGLIFYWFWLEMGLKFSYYS